MDPVVAAAVAEAHRTEWGRVLAAAARLTGDLDAAEECAQDAYAEALGSWMAHGVPDRPGAWLTTVARRRAMDIIRRRDILRAKLPLLAGPDPAGGDGDDGDAAMPDDRLRLIFICCHPALAPDARVALTLRLLCGLTTAEVASAFVTSEPTMAARITRAKKKIATARIPYRVPGPGELPERLAAVLDVVHLVFTTGHTAPAGAALQRRDLAERALDLARMLRLLLPDEPAVAGLLALILLTDARRGARTDPNGRLLLISEQDRARWDHDEISEGLTLAREALRSRPYTRYPLMAAIAATHATAPAPGDPNWAQILSLYDELIAIWPSPIVALNRAVAVGEARGPAAGLAALDVLAAEPQLAGYHYLPAARAEYLRRLDRNDEARLAYDEALLLAGNATEREFLAARRGQLPPGHGGAGHGGAGHGE
ncbi:MAG: RNA polymerase subunit sigma-24 [Streptosporangiaceae bacterium]|nr:RNA polymerase subunit sigma-24 [Streptosporangiaceae bacterium]MBV9856532.1 RNA polymerase subunit sigma-24 [Streptosporangiaceae bacterium]